MNFAVCLIHSSLFGRQDTNLVSRYSISKDLIISQRIASLTTGISGVAFDSIDSSVFYFCYDANMVRQTIRTAGFLLIPVKEDYHARCGFSTVVCPLPALFEPVDTVDATCEFVNNTSIIVATLIGSPRYKTSTPRNPDSLTVCEVYLRPICTYTKPYRDSLQLTKYLESSANQRLLYKNSCIHSVC